MIIFDLDQTLVDTSPVQHLREAGNWKAVMAKAPSLSIYDGIQDLLEELHEKGQRIAILTKSPDMVAKKFVSLHKWPIDIVIGYHQVKGRVKPLPDGLLLIMKEAGALAKNTFHIGDHPNDTAASRAAGVVAIGAAWGIPDTAGLKASRPDQLFESVADLHRYFGKRF